jgi:periplasmic divalent cation tolerance protein
MATDDRPVLVYTTFARLEEAKGVGEALVAAGLAACVNIFPGMISIYEWKGARETADEVAMIIKTRASLADAVLIETKRLHPYEVPALLVLPTEGGSEEYAAWLADQTKGAELP